MRVIVVGAGLLGVSTAYFLARSGHEVTILERRGDAGMETSYANSGMVTPSQADPWNSPGTLKRLLGWLGNEASPFIVNPSVIPSMLGWGLSFLRNAGRERFRASLARNATLANYSLDTFRLIRSESQVHYDQILNGTMKLYRNAEAFDKAAAVSDTLREAGVRHEILDAEGVTAREPALRNIAAEISGGVYYPDDEAGDAHKFCSELRVRAEEKGAEFRFAAPVTDIRHSGGRISSVITPGRVFTADACVIAAGSYSVGLCRLLGLKLPVTPVKGYSVTLARGGWADGPAMPVIDDFRHVAVTPLGTRIRAAGMAEFAGFDTDVDSRRTDVLLGILDEIYPGFAAVRDMGSIRRWAGLRPYCVDGVPVIGPARYRNLYLNTGHGHLGWSMSAGSGRLLADIISGRETDIDAAPYRFARFE